MKIHLIAVGGSVMHNFAIALHDLGYTVTGSDDQIYDPARSRLKERGLLPSESGWDSQRITSDLDAVIVGMHARKDNPELQKAQLTGLPIYSFPEFFANHMTGKTRVAVAGSHGKTTTTGMILHVTRTLGLNADYLVGAQLPGFDTMVRLSDAPVAIMEADEYLSSPIDNRPKFMHYHPQITVLTGIAWDHINVFPTEAAYTDAFRKYLQNLPDGASVFFDQSDSALNQLINEFNEIHATPYRAFPHRLEKGRIVLQGTDGTEFPSQIVGVHNMHNLMGAWLACQQLGIGERDFLEAISTFGGAAKRLQLLGIREGQFQLFLDFAHAPSKVRATVTAVRQQFGDERLVVCLELHTFSSLNREFLHQYAGTLDAADEACIFYSPETLRNKRLPALDANTIRQAFSKPELAVLETPAALAGWLEAKTAEPAHLLVMSSGRLGGFDISGFAATSYPEQ